MEKVGISARNRIHESQLDRAQVNKNESMFESGLHRQKLIVIHDS